MHLQLCIQLEAFAVIVTQIGIPHCQRPYFIAVELLNTPDILIKVGGEFEGGQIIIAIGGDYQDAIFLHKLAQVHTLSVVVQAQYVWVKPHLTSAQSRVTFLLQGDSLHLVFGQHIASCGTALYCQLAQVLDHLQFLEVQCRLELNLNHLCLAIRVRGEVHHT